MIEVSVFAILALIAISLSIGVVIGLLFAALLCYSLIARTERRILNEEKAKKRKRQKRGAYLRVQK